MIHWLPQDGSKLIAECSFDFKGDRRHCALIGNRDATAFRAPQQPGRELASLWPIGVGREV
jgi:hypothetical protein